MVGFGKSGWCSVMALCASLLLCTASVPAWSAPVPIGRASTEMPPDQKWQILPLPRSYSGISSGFYGEIKVAHTVVWLVSGRTIDAVLMFEGSEGTNKDGLQWSASCEGYKASKGMFVRNQWFVMRNETRDDCLIAAGPFDLAASLKSIAPEIAAMIEVQGPKFDGPGYIVRTRVAQGGTFLDAWLFVREAFKGSDKALSVALGVAELPPSVVQWGVEMSSAVRGSTLSPSGRFVLPRIDFGAGTNALASRSSNGGPSKVEIAALDPAGAPTTANSSDICPNYAEVMEVVGYPREASIAGITDGTVMVEFVLAADGDVTNVKAIRSSHPIFAEAAIAGVKRLKCIGKGRGMRVRVPLGFQSE
jgi:TonB family protein